jgi:3-hydroxyacyl-[acyl-carrier-protein] dehydratase
VIKVKLEANKLEADIVLNPGHKIYKGHFPGQPILPGVLQLQLVQEILSEALHKKLRLKSSLNIKFLSMIDPGREGILSAVIEIISESEEGYKVSARLHSGNTVFLRFKGVYTFE